jgi:two-component system LytT family response regulator
VQTKDKGIQDHQVKGLLNLIKENSQTYKSTFLVNQRDQLIPLKTNNIAYFRIDTGIVKAITHDHQSYNIDGKLEELEDELDPTRFYRANRQFIVKRDAIANIKYYFNGKLILSVNPPSAERIVVSKAKATEFKNWMNS